MHAASRDFDSCRFFLQGDQNSKLNYTDSPSVVGKAVCAQDCSTVEHCLRT